MDKSKKIYKKALLSFEKGHIDKAIQLCEECISMDINNSAALDLKGMLCYFKGNLNEAKTVWKLNVNANRDVSAKKYLEDTIEDEARLNYYIIALKRIKNVEIKEALELLDKCSESSYNCINVDNHKAICYIRQGRYQKAIESIEKVLKVDANNEMALKSRKELIDLGVIKGAFNMKKVYKPAAAIVVILLLVLGTVEIKNYIKNNRTQTKKTIMKKTAPNKTVKKEVKKPVEKPKVPKKEEVFNTEELQTAVNNKDFNKIYDYEEKWKDNKNIKVNDKILLSKAMDMLLGDGVQYFYKAGTDLIKNKNYEGAKDNLLKAYKYGEKNYLYSDIIYFIAETYKNTNDAESAMNYYSMYDQKFEKGSYEETVLYNLAIMNKDVNIDVAKKIC
ncbi:hypothetical protein [Clostridium acetobutylicum]|uniref:hypothetical protein n=1 Tax=Clostridium acetobutylicum TaxID=1488 RepID=UPI00181F24CA|nr:hypothetical protein [Clostridium acetobutylicum]NYC92930.1 tetratricopeptide (TPR) repeat protein [Clostridium acetobutylicum]